MINIEQSVLNVFKENPSTELETSYIASQVFSDEYAEINSQLISSDNKTIHEAKRRKFQLHRKLLYYLNKLVDENILKLTRIHEKGEKSFGLAAEDGNITIEKGYKKIVITKPNLPTNYMEKYEKQNLMKKYEEDSWITKLNSAMLECSRMHTVDRLYIMLTESLKVINDVVALNDFDIMINNYDTKGFLDKIASDTLNTDRTVSLIINSSNMNKQKFMEFIKYYVIINPKRINIIFNLTIKDLNKNSELFQMIIKEFSTNKIKINFKNNSLSEMPYFKGKSGMYTFDDEDWKQYKSNNTGTIGALCSQLSIAININKFFEEYSTDSEFRKALINAAKTMLLATTIQRRRSNEYFRNINVLNNNNYDFYRFTRNYFRFWNYDWHRDLEEKSNLFELMKSSKELIDNFCITEETIFKSCGLPIRFRIAFSSAFRNFDAKFMGEREYKKANIRSVQDFYGKEIKEYITRREKMFEIFDGGDRMRIFRTAEFETEDIIHEISTILNSLKIPFFTYDFSGLLGIVKLTNYI